MHGIRALTLRLLLVSTVGWVATVSAEGPPVSGTLAIATTSIASGLGATWGEGLLTTQGKRYRFALEGLEVGAVVVFTVQVTGQVYHLGTVADVEGTYVAVEGGAAVGAGEGVLTIRNQHGVVIDLQSVPPGGTLTAGVGGIKLTLKKRRSDKKLVHHRPW